MIVKAERAYFSRLALIAAVLLASTATHVFSRNPNLRGYTRDSRDLIPVTQVSPTTDVTLDQRLGHELTAKIGEVVVSYRAQEHEETQSFTLSFDQDAAIVCGSGILTNKFYAIGGMEIPVRHYVIDDGVKYWALHLSRWKNSTNVVRQGTLIGVDAETLQSFVWMPRDERDPTVVDSAKHRCRVDPPSAKIAASAAKTSASFAPVTKALVYNGTFGIASKFIEQTDIRGEVSSVENPPALQKRGNALVWNGIEIEVLEVNSDQMRYRLRRTIAP